MKPIAFLALLFFLPQTPSFRSASSELVVVPVIVKDRQGKLVPDLPREGFVVYDNGRRQEISLFSREDSPVSIALVIDDSGSMRNKLRQVTEAALAFAHDSNPDDELFAIEFNDSVRDALGGRRITADDERELEGAFRTLVPAGRTALYDAVLDGLGHLNAAAHARRVLVLVSDGGDNASLATLDRVLAEAHRANVTIYTIGIYDEDASDTNPGVLRKLSAATGGERVLPRSADALRQALVRISREIRSGYTIGYEPPDRDGAYHRVTVQIVPGRRFDIRTRPGYFAAGVPRAPSGDR
jgi:Ca-activated chloride channel family protein